MWTGLSKKRRKIKPKCALTLFPCMERLGKTASYRITARRPLQRPTLQSSFSESVASTNKENEEAATFPVTTVSISQEECIVQLEAKAEALQKKCISPRSDCCLKEKIVLPGQFHK